MIKHRRDMMSAPQYSAEVLRRHIVVRGQVQGVGFRPFVYRLAAGLGLRGWVCNCGEGVEIEVQGGAGALQSFVARLHDEAPPQARIVAVEQTAVPSAAAAPPFCIATSRADAARTAVAADAAVCADCLGELFDPGDRRYRYPFINCAQCGPRFTISRALPYDRPNTSMAAFHQCRVCQSEYEDAGERRFHAQANACPECGPRLRWHDGEGVGISAPDAVAASLTALRAGHIVALKGLGGFHLLCDARNAEAVARLRVRKAREAKPLALMAANLASLSPWTRGDERQQTWLQSPARPIVLLEKTARCDQALRGIAPDIAHVGVMLPYTPLHYLLFHEAAGRPAGTAWLQQPQTLLLVCTSANAGGEPLVIADQEAYTRLRGIADSFVAHNRDIEQRCDDSVVKVVGGAPMLMRRSRGYVPQPIKLPRAGPAVLALGGDLKNTVCLTQGDEAYVSQHNGDLDNAAACRALEETVSHWLMTLPIAPTCVIHDRHPDFFSSRLARRLAGARDVPCMAVQHHHAHIAAVAAEHGVQGAVLGLALDGFGLGDDGGLWGGELLRVAGAQSWRLGHLHRLALPGGDRAAREPWRMAASALHALGRGDEIARRFPRPGAEIMMQMLDKRVNAPLTSSAGRWFDAAAGLLGIAARSSYEGEAAMVMEALALRHGPVTSRRDDYRVEQDGVLNLLPLIDRLSRAQDAAYGATLFHAGLVAALSDWLQGAARRESLDTVVLGGGCFMNGVLSAGLRDALQAAGLNVLVAAQLPPNDGGLSLGQAWVGISALVRDTDERPCVSPFPP
jgi:hydrogenase maturation protein HypF